MATVFAAIGTAMASAGASIGTMFGAGAAGAGAAAGGAAAAGAAGAAASGGSILTISNVLSAGSALAAIGQGISAKYQAQSQAAFAGAQAEQELAVGASQARDLSREYAELTGEQKVIQLANGLDIGIGTPVSISESTKRIADQNIEMTRKNAGNRAAMTRLRQRGLMSEGRAAMMAGYGRAAAIGADAYQLTG